MFCPFARDPQTFVVAVVVFCQDIIQKAHLQNATSAGVLVHHFMCILISWWVDVGNSSSDIMRNSKSAVVRLCCLTEGLRTTQQRFYHIFFPHDCQLSSQQTKLKQCKWVFRENVGFARMRRDFHTT